MISTRLAASLTTVLLSFSVATARQPVGLHAGFSPVGLRSPQFLAISVADVELSARWYSRTFNLDLLKDVPAKDSQVHTRLLHSPELVVELSQHATAKPLRGYVGAPTPTFLVHGFFKAGMFVENLERSVEILRQRGVADIGAVQSDKLLGLRWVLFRDNGGNFLQLLERSSAGR
jgi:hypothetical protein